MNPSDGIQRLGEGLDMSSREGGKADAARLETKEDVEAAARAGRVLIVDEAMGEILGMDLSMALSPELGCDLIGSPSPKSDARCRSKDNAEAEFQRNTKGQTLSRQVLRWRRRKGLPT